MANSGRTSQPGGSRTAFGAMADRVQDIAAAWRGDKLSTRVRVTNNDGEATSLTLAGETIPLSGAQTVRRYLRPGSYTVTFDLAAGWEVDTLDGDPVSGDVTIEAGGTYEVAIAEEA